MQITPKHIFRGRTSDGKSFRAEEWDFATLSNMEFSGMLVIFFILLVFEAFAAPFIVLMTTMFGVRNSLLNFFAMCFGFYFLVDVSSGWIVLTALNTVFEEKTIDIIYMANVTSVCFATAGLFFNISPFDNFIYTLVLVALSLFYIGFNKQQKGWVGKRLDYTQEKTQLQREKDSLLEVGSFNSKQERDEYFKRINKEWGNY